ncbi:D-isomer specific 2-hydroxyacid dehydrogenase [Nemania sp. FL0031]|nr:D-isomer specific 2-hydroxyacid dehydrogenase [Nemania sp. FL0031]
MIQLARRRHSYQRQTTSLGKRLSVLCQGLGMEVMVSERKAVTSVDRLGKGSAIRHPFRDVIERATVLFICCTSSSETQNMIDAAELSTMRPEAVIVNVSRGDVLNTDAAVKALRKDLISGVTVDMFDHEPASTAEDSAFFAEDSKDLNLTFSPRVGYLSTQAVVTMKMMVRTCIKSFVAGNFDDFIA